MHGIFIAAGPDLPQGKRIATVRMIDVQPLVLTILGLEGPGAIDGDPDVLVPLLRSRRSQPQPEASEAP